MRLFITSLCFIQILLIDCINVYAQNDLSGIVKDKKNGLPISGAYIYIADLKTGAISDDKGFYSIKNIPSGYFLVESGSIGFSQQTDHILINGKTIKHFELNIAIDELNEVIVTGVPSAIKKRESPVIISSLNNVDLLQTTSSNIIDALQTIPGVSQITEGPAISKPVIRGLGYNRVVVINDGIRQEGQQWGDEFGIEIDEFTANKIEILKGPSSLSYGSDAMAGVINILSQPTLTEGKIRGSVLANYQSNNGLLATSLNMAGNEKGFVWDIRYSNKMAHDYQNKYDGYVWNSGYGENDFKTMIGLHKNWGYSHLTFSYFDLKLGIIEGSRDSATGLFTTHYLDNNNNDSLGIAPASDYKKYNNYPIIHQHVRHYKLVWDNNITMGKGRLALKLGWQQNYRQEANDITQGDIYNNYFFLRTLNYDLQYVLENKKNTQWSFGINGMQQSSEDRGIVFLVPEYKLFDIGAFTTFKKSINKITISGGIRIDSRRLNTSNLYVDSNGVRLPAPAPGSINRFTAFQTNFSGISGSIGLAYDFTKNLYGKLNISRGFRAPNIAEAGSDGIHDGTPFYEIGDPTLKAESSVQLDATLGMNNEDISAEINPFVNKINNYIFPSKLQSVHGGDSLREDFTSGLPPGTTFKYIAGDAILSGGEIVLNIHPHSMSWLSLNNSFSFIRAIQLNQSDSTKYLPYTPPQKLASTLIFSYRRINDYFKNVSIRIGIENYFTQDKIYYKFGNETITPGYTLLNAGFNTDIYSSRKNIFSLFFAVNNLTNVAYQSNMSRLKYGDENNVTGRIGVYNMGRNFSLKLIIPINIKE